MDIHCRILEYSGRAIIFNWASEIGSIFEKITRDSLLFIAKKKMNFFQTRFMMFPAQLHPPFERITCGYENA